LASETQRPQKTEKRDEARRTATHREGAGALAAGKHMTDERQSWRKAFEALGPQQLRLRLEHRRGEYDGEYGREAERWLLEQDAKAAAVERKRFQTLRCWAIVAGVPGVKSGLSHNSAKAPRLLSRYR
jgi:hypothetical protein